MKSISVQNIVPDGQTATSKNVRHMLKVCGLAMAAIVLTTSIASASTIAVTNGGFETIGDWSDGTWARFGSPWSPSGGTYMQVKAVPGQFSSTVAGGGVWVVNLNSVSIGTPLKQDLGTSVSTGETLSVTFWIGRSKTGGGGQGVSYFKVNTTLYPMTHDISSLAADSWQSYTNTQTITNSGNVSIGFYGNNGSGSNCWLDLISNVTVTPPGPLPPTWLTAVRGPVSGSVLLNWNVSDGATGYKVYISTTNNGTAYGFVGATSGLTATNYTALVPHFMANYYYAVTATNSDGESDWSVPSNVINLSVPGTVIMIR